MPSQNITYLREHGPAPASELPVQVHSRQRHEGILRFRITGARGQTKNVGWLDAIYYLEEHDPEAILRAFCDANPRFVESKTLNAFTRAVGRHGSAWREAASGIAVERGLELHVDPDDRPLSDPPTL